MSNKRQVDSFDYDPYHTREIDKLEKELSMLSETNPSMAKIFAERFSKTALNKAEWDKVTDEWCTYIMNKDK